MKRKRLIQLLEHQGCILLRHGGGHDIYLNSATGKRAPIPRNTEIKDSLVRLICRQLDVKID